MFGIEAAFSGRLGRDPELRMVKSGTMAMVTLAVAVDEAPPKDGHDAKSTWINCKLFGDKATTAAEALAKGDRVYLEGKLSLDNWTGKDGRPRTGLSVVANVAQPLGKIGNRRPRQSRDGAQDNRQRSSGNNQQRRAAQAPLNHDDMPNDDIPW
jgi:single-strand DNA-binding protein